ncbi:MAG: sulfite exporter TauE/SafE family protein [Defluviitaleaceae bacterium]|nr:sulfite exporter TauE/SafE family protein [Defluviitaleaceae bacterium]
MKYLKSPWLEGIIMLLAVLIGFLCLTVLAHLADYTVAGEMATGNIVLIIFTFFVLSVIIAMIGVIAGIGGGVIFTPIMLAFTSVNSLVVRATGIIVSMFSSPVSIGIFTKKGLVNFRLCLIMAISQSIGAFIGATIAIATAAGAGAFGEGLMRFSLGILLLLLAAYFFFGGKNLEWPVIKHVDKFTAALKLEHSYFEESEGVVKHYKLRRAFIGMLLIFAVGLIGGFFGMGGGWAITPTLNLGMGVPLKLSSVNSGIILGLSGGVSVWPFMATGSVIPLFVMPWLAGQVIGGFLGSHLLAKIRVSAVRMILIGIMFFTSFTLVMAGLEMIGLIRGTAAIVDVIMFIVIMLCVGVSIVRQHKRS